MMYNILCDLDGTVCDDIKNEDSHLYGEAKTYAGAIEWINELYAQGHIITFFTAREEKDRQITENWLYQQGFKFHYLLMNKPRGGNYVWIDNLNVASIKFEGDFTELTKNISQVFAD